MEHEVLPPSADALFLLWVSGDALGKLRFRWEIRQQVPLKTVEVSEERCPTMAKAHAAGFPILRLWQRGKRLPAAPAQIKVEPPLVETAPGMDAPTIKASTNRRRGAISRGTRLT